MEIGFDIKNTFFDRTAVMKKVSPAKRSVLPKAGAFVRRRARSSLRKRKAPAAVGSPPSIHYTAEPNLRTIFFGYDAASDSVVVGPVKFDTKLGPNRFRPRNTTVPRLLELGGAIPFDDAAKRRLAAKLNGLFDKGRDGAGRFLKGGAQRANVGNFKSVRTYQPRPFMGPAAAAEAPNFPGLWADAIR